MKNIHFKCLFENHENDPNKNVGHWTIRAQWPHISSEIYFKQVEMCVRVISISTFIHIFSLFSHNSVYYLHINANGIDTNLGSLKFCQHKMMVCWIGCCEHRNLFKTHYNNNIIMIISLVLFITGNKTREKNKNEHSHI